MAAVLVIVFSVFCVAEAVDLFEPHVKVYGRIRPTFKVTSGNSVDRAEFDLNRVFLNVDKDFKDGKFGLHTETQYQQHGYGGYPDEVWLEEGYVYFNSDYANVKAGKIYTPIGIRWDHTFYGSIVYYKGFMADPDYGLTFDRTDTVNVVNKDVDIKSTLGYFVREDDLNGQTVIGEGYEYLNRGERNTYVFRVNPSLKINENSSLKLGVSGLMGEVKAPEADNQAAIEMDLVYNIGPLTLTGEYIFYDRAYSSKNDILKGECFLVEAYLDVYKNPDAKYLQNIALNYNYSKDDTDSGANTGQIHLPSVIFQVTKSISTEVLFVDWTSTKNSTTSDRSWWMIVCIDF